MIIKRDNTYKEEWEVKEILNFKLHSCWKKLKYLMQWKNNIVN